MLGVGLPAIAAVNSPPLSQASQLPQGSASATIITIIKRHTTLLGLVLIGAVMITTYFAEVFGVPFLLILSAVYYGFFRKGRARASSKAWA